MLSDTHHEGLSSGFQENCLLSRLLKDDSSNSGMAWLKVAKNSSTSCTAVCLDGKGWKTRWSKPSCSMRGIQLVNCHRLAFCCVAARHAAVQFLLSCSPASRVEEGAQNPEDAPKLC